MSGNNQFSASRRTVLKSLASSTAILATGVSAAAGRSERGSGSRFKDIIEHSLEVRRQTGSMEVWRNYLRSRGISGKTNTLSFAADDGGVSTNHISDDSDLDITIGFMHDCDGEYYGELSWTYNPDGGFGHADVGKPPMDGAGLYYDEDWWNLAFNTVEDP